MNTTATNRKSDVKPIEFSLAIILGGMGSAILSGLQLNPIYSVAFALLVMGTLAFLRWQIASEHKDYQSLESFAEDIYLLGYLLTLAALLGLAPRLMSDESNLFKIAGLKLVTTVVGLAFMMIFRQIARRWAEERAEEEISMFVRQQQQFSQSVARLNEGADQLTGKLSEVLARFDPQQIDAVAEWSGRATQAFGKATTTFEELPTAFEKTMRCLNDLNGHLGLIRNAANEFSNALGNGTVQAARSFTSELSQAGRATTSFGGVVASMQPAGESAARSLEGLGKNAELGLGRLNDVSAGLGRTASELARVDAALQRVVEINACDADTPLNRMVKALEASVSASITAAGKVEGLKGELEEMAANNRTLVKDLGVEISTPIKEQHKVLEQVQSRLLEAASLIEKLGNSKQAEPANDGLAELPELQKQLLQQLQTMTGEIKRTNEQLQLLVARTDGGEGADNRHGFFSRFIGGGR
jgi:hypothetical protein